MVGRHPPLCRVRVARFWCPISQGVDIMQTSEKRPDLARGAKSFRDGRESSARSVPVRRVSLQKSTGGDDPKKPVSPLRTSDIPRRGPGERGSCPWMQSHSERVFCAFRASKPHVTPAGVTCGAAGTNRRQPESPCAKRRDRGRVSRSASEQGVRSRRSLVEGRHSGSG